MKKQITALVLGALITASMPVTAFAANHGHTAANIQTTSVHAACSIENCNTTGLHQHDGKSYAGHTIDDGHGYHQVCSVENCTQTGTHDHDGKTYFEHHNEDGHTYHAGQHKAADGHNRHNGNGRHHS